MERVYVLYVLAEMAKRVVEGQPECNDGTCDDYCLKRTRDGGYCSGTACECFDLKP